MQNRKTTVVKTTTKRRIFVVRATIDGHSCHVVMVTRNMNPSGCIRNPPESNPTGPRPCRPTPSHAQRPTRKPTCRHRIRNGHLHSIDQIRWKGNWPYLARVTVVLRSGPPLLYLGWTDTGSIDHYNKQRTKQSSIVAGPR